jgi:hypothetical protein
MYIIFFQLFFILILMMSSHRLHSLRCQILLVFIHSSIVTTSRLFVDIIDLFEQLQKSNFYRSPVFASLLQQGRSPSLAVLPPIVLLSSSELGLVLYLMVNSTLVRLQVELMFDE